MTTERSYDPAGALTIAGGLVLAVYAVVEAPTKGWAGAQTIGLLAVSAALLVAFVLIELRHRAPLVPMRIFRSRTLVGANSVMLFFGAALGVAVVATVSVTHTKDFFAANPHAVRLVGLTEGFQSAFFASSIIAAAGAIAAFALLGRPRRSAEETLEPAPLPAGG